MKLKNYTVSSWGYLGYKHAWKPKKIRFDESIWMDSGNTRSTPPPPLWSSTAPHRLWHSLGVEVEGMMTDNATSKTRSYCTTKFLLLYKFV